MDDPTARCPAMIRTMVAIGACGSVLLAACAPQGTGSTPNPRWVSVAAPFDSIKVPAFSSTPGLSLIDSVRESNLRPRHWGIESAPPCRVPRMVDTTGWVPAVAGGRAYPFRIPPDFVYDSSDHGIHGAVRWQGPRGYLVLSNKWAGPNLADGFLRACRLAIPAGDYLVEQYGRGETAGVQAFEADTIWRSRTVFTGRGRDTLALAIAWTALRTLRSEAPIRYQ